MNILDDSQRENRQLTNQCHINVSRQTGSDTPLSGRVFDIRRYSIHDGPGIRSVVFLKGCPLHCLWCHNPESQSGGTDMMVFENRCIRCGSCIEVCPEGAITWDGDQPITNWEVCQLCGTCVASCFSGARQQLGQQSTIEQVLSVIMRDTPFYDESGGGITLSGGEPLVQAGFVFALLRDCRKLGIHTAVDTCGYASWSVFERLIPYVNLWLYDLKVMDPERHRQYTGVSNELILNNLRNLAAVRQFIHLRIPIIPGVNDDQANLQGLARFASQLSRLEKVELLPYHRIHLDKYHRLRLPYLLQEIQLPTDEQMASAAYTMSKFDLPVQIG